MYDLPKRPEQHVIDEKGKLLLQSILNPQHYIFRELGGRDYGIDGILETVDDGKPTGRMMSIQLKSSEHFQDFDIVNRGVADGIGTLDSICGVIEGSIHVCIKKLLVIIGYRIPCR